MSSTKASVSFPSLQQVTERFGLEPYGRVQTFIDLEIARLSDDYVPMDTGATRKSVFVNSRFGSGELIYDAYRTRNGTIWDDTTLKFQDAPRRGVKWVLRMWEEGGKEKVTQGAERLIGRGKK
jgi:hypothetical protein